MHLMCAIKITLSNRWNKEDHSEQIPGGSTQNRQQGAAYPQKFSKNKKA